MIILLMGLGDVPWLVNESSELFMEVSNTIEAFSDSLAWSVEMALLPRRTYFWEVVNIGKIDM